MPHPTHSAKCLTDQVRGHTFLPNCLNRTGKVVDLGMNKGDFAKVMRDRYGCSVAGAEANPSLAAATSNFSGIRCKNAVISGSDGSIEFFTNPTNSEASKVATFRSIDTIIMPCMSLSTFFREIGAEEVDLLKIDIEGAELNLLEKADPNDLLRCAQITIEFHSFVFPEQALRVESAITKLSMLGFYHIDFSTRMTDVLFINHNMIELSAADKLYLGFQKYRSGFKRRLSRLGGLPNRPAR
jgi:FkbM family methyltransferase